MFEKVLYVEVADQHGERHLVTEYAPASGVSSFNSPDGEELEADGNTFVSKVSGAVFTRV